MDILISIQRYLLIRTSLMRQFGVIDCVDQWPSGIPMVLLWQQNLVRMLVWQQAQGIDQDRDDGKLLQRLGHEF